MAQCFILSIFLMLVSFSVIGSQANIETTLMPNVVSVSAKIGNQFEKGFAIVVGENNDKYYFATANHVVRGKTSRDKTENITVQFHQAEALKFDAELHSVSDRKLDIAFFTVKKHQKAIRLSAHEDRPPIVLFRWDAMGAPENDLTHHVVSSIGKLGKWDLISGGAKISRQEHSYFYVEHLQVDKGSSGSPLLDNHGIIGLLTEHDNQSSKAVSLLQVKAIALQYGIPWNLSERTQETDLNGVWQVQEKWQGDSTYEEPSQIKITHTDLVRFKIKADGSGAKGFGIIQGKRAKVWWESNLWGDEFGEFTLKTDGNSNISLHGRAVDDESGEEYQIRVTQLGLQNSPQQTNTIIGCWNIQGIGNMTIKQDHSTQSGPYDGKLYSLGQDKYEVLWNRFVDKLKLSNNRSILQGTNNYAWPVKAHKIGDSTHSVSGTWDWGGPLMDFSPDGNVRMNNVIVGRWLTTSGDNVEVHWLSRFAYFIRFEENAPTFTGTMGIRFETTQPMPNIEINGIIGQRC